MSRARRTRALVLASAVVVLLASCSGSTSLPSEITAAAPSDTGPTTTAFTVPDCTQAQEDAVEPTASYAALEPLPGPDELPPGSKMAEIKARGRLVVGVSGDTLLFGARNPFTTELEGVDIDMLTEVAKAIFGDDGADHIEFQVITYADRLPKLISRDVDVVAHTMTINCKRWQKIAFSAVYFEAGQRVLVKRDSGFTSVQDLEAAKATVCAPNGSTNIDEISDPEKHPGIVVLGKDDISECLVAMQQGLADATTGDDTVLAGFHVQDPNTEVVGDAFTSEPYGLGFNAEDVDFVRFVNALLEQLRSDGRYDAIIQKWLIDTGALKDIKPVPAPDYSRPLP